jgi:hypothetical protein
MHRALGLAGLLACASLASGLSGCGPKRPPIGGNPYGDPSLGTSVWLFGFDSPAVRQLVPRIKGGQGLIAVRYTTDGPTAALEVLPNCHISGSYKYAQYSMRQKTLRIESKDQLAASLPLSYAHFAAAVEQQTKLEIEYKSPGDYNAVMDQIALGEGCEGATHVVEHVFVGAYVTHQMAAQKIQASGAAPGPIGPSASGGSSGLDEAKTSAGMFNACDQNSPEAPPLDCDEPLNLSLRAIGSIKTNVVSCQDPSLMNPSHGFSFTGQVFTLEPGYLKALDPNVDPEFACKPEITPGEKKALDKVIGFLSANGSVKAHVSVWCSPLLPFSPMQPQQHEASLRGVFASAGLAGRVEFDNCMPGLIPVGANGVYVELTSGCKEFQTKPAFKCQKNP